MIRKTLIRQVIFTIFLLHIAIGFIRMPIGAGEEQRKSSAIRPTETFDNLEGKWLFRIDPKQIGEKQNWHRPGYDDSGWREIRVPGYWEEQGVISTYPGMPCPEIDPKVARFNAYNGAAWYRLRVIVPKDWRSRGALELFIGAADDLDSTYFNGALIGKTGEGLRHPSIASRSYLAPSRLVNFGDENTIAIRVWDGGGPGGINRGPVYLLPRRIFSKIEAMAKKGSRDDMDLKSRFQNPPNHRRILQIIHNFPKETSSHRAFIASLLARGFGGVVCNVHFDDYLRSEENWKSFAHAVKIAREMGMTIWLYDEQGYPSGVAGGIVLEGHPEWEPSGLACVEATSKGNAIEIKLPDGEIISAVACPLTDGGLNLKAAVDIRNSIDDARVLKWKSPAGQWQVMAFVVQRLYEGTHAVANVFAKRPYINLLMREPVTRFIEVTHQEYARRFPDMRDTFEAIFTDEPSLMSVFMRPQPHAVIPWSPMLAGQFKEQKGYDLIPHLPALFADAGAVSGRARCDFWAVVGEQVSDGFFKQIQDWCHRNGIASTGHLLLEESIAAHVGYYGNFFQCAKYLDIPGIDCLTSYPPGCPWHIAKLLGSIAHLRRCEKTMSETSDFAQRYRPEGDKRPPQEVGPAEIRGACNLLYVGGVNSTTSYYSWQGLSSEEQRQVNEYVGRMGVMITGGVHCCDIAMLYPVESLWTHFTPARNGPTDSPQVAEIDRIYRDLSYQLFKNRRDFDYVDSDSLREAALVKDGLGITDERYRVLVLPCVETLPDAVWRKAVEFWRAGGVITAVAAAPRNSLKEFPSEDVMALSKEVFGDKMFSDNAERQELFSVNTNERGGAGVFVPSGNELLIPSILDTLLQPDFETEAALSPLRYTHRRIENRDIYFVINDSPDSVEETVFLCGEGEAEVWNPETGEITPRGDCQTDAAKGASKLTLSVNGYSSAFVVFPKSKAPARRSAINIEIAKLVKPIEDAVAGPLNFRGLSPQHVRTKVTRDEAISRDDEPMTRVESEITLGGVDSWCFPEARFEQPADFSAYRGLRFWSYAPEGQTSCGARVLVVLQEEDGADYIADAHRSLNTPGRQMSTLWFDSFQLGGWSKDSNGKLDLSKIRAIRIGWGGYFGKENERVVYAFNGIELIGFMTDGK